MIRALEPSPLGAAPRPKPTLPGQATEFLNVQPALGRKTNSHDPAVVEQTAAQMLSQLFFGPLLAEMRKLPFGGSFADGGRTEEIFGEQLDNRIADAVASSQRGLTQQVAAYFDPTPVRAAKIAEKQKSDPSDGRTTVDQLGKAALDREKTGQRPVPQVLQDLLGRGLVSQVSIRAQLK